MLHIIWSVIVGFFVGVLSPKQYCSGADAVMRFFG